MLGIRALGRKVAASGLCLALAASHAPAASAAQKGVGTNQTGTTEAGVRHAPAAVPSNELRIDLQVPDTGSLTAPLTGGAASLEAPIAAPDSPAIGPSLAPEAAALQAGPGVAPVHSGHAPVSAGRGGPAASVATEAPERLSIGGDGEDSGGASPTRLSEAAAIAAVSHSAGPGAAPGFDRSIRPDDTIPVQHSFEAEIVGPEILARRRTQLSAALRGEGSMPAEVAEEMASKDRALMEYRAAADAGQPRAMVIVNSISTEHDTGMVGEEDYCKRLLIILHKAAADPNLRIVYASATMPDPALIRAHVLRHLPRALVDELIGPAGEPLDANLGRVKFVSLDDGRAREEGGRRITFIEKLLLPRHAAKVDRMRALVGEQAGPAIIYSYLSTHGEAELARRLGIPDAVLGTQPDLLRELNSKSMGRKIAREAGVPILRGREDIDSLDKLVDNIHGLSQELGGLRSVYIKLNYGISGGGNWRFHLPPNWSEMSRDPRIAHLRRELGKRMVGPTSTFLDQLRLQGAVIEEDMTEEFAHAEFPSVQTGTLFQRDGSFQIEIYSTHNQRVDEKGVFQGATSPADEDIRPELIEYGRRITEAYAKLGLRGEWSALDFAAVRPKAGGKRRLIFMEPNHRLSGTTHLYLGAAALGGRMSPDGEIRDRKGRLMYYASRDHRVNPVLKDGHREGLDPGVFVQYANREENARIIDYFDKENKVRITVFFYLLVLRQSGNAGYEVIGTALNRKVDKASVVKAVRAAEERLGLMLNAIDISHVSNGAKAGEFRPGTGGVLENELAHQAPFGGSYLVHVRTYPDGSGGDLFPEAGSNGRHIELMTRLMAEHPDLLFDPSRGQLNGMVPHSRGSGFSIMAVDPEEFDRVHARLTAAARSISK